LAIVEHGTKEYNGQIVNFYSVTAYLAKNGFQIDAPISKAGFTKRIKRNL
jgi:hypothetical protein